jgi:hypothetical protein
VSFLNPLSLFPGVLLTPALSPWWTSSLFSATAHFPVSHSPWATWGQGYIHHGGCWCPGPVLYIRIWSIVHKVSHTASQGKFLKIQGTWIWRPFIHSLLLCMWHTQ